MKRAVPTAAAHPRTADHVIYAAVVRHTRSAGGGEYRIDSRRDDSAVTARRRIVSLDGCECHSSCAISSKKPTAIRPKVHGLTTTWCLPPATAHRSSRATSNRSFDRRIVKADVPQITVLGARRTCGSLLAALDVHPRVAMQILRHSKIGLTMEIYTEVPSASTRDALKRLGQWLGS
jgi:integrase